MTNKKSPPITYTNRDFESIKQDLVNYAKIYYPEVYKDFNEASFGSLLFDMIAYVGDNLSFYLDYQLNETFIDTALETKNILKLARQLGYKYPGSASSSGMCAFYVNVPALNGEPDPSLIPVLHKNTSLGSNSGAYFILNEDVDFSSTTAQVVVSEVDTNGQPTSFAYKAYGEVISGKVTTELVEVDSYERFMNIKLGDTNITEIISIIDSDGHEFFEVDYLSQNIIYKMVRNRKSEDKDLAPYILRETIVPRRFVVEHNINGNTYLQFGYGSNEELKENNFPDPSVSILKKHAKDYYNDSSFDPSMLLKTEKFGVVPAEGTMTVSYRKNTTSNVNISVGSLTSVINSNISFPSSGVTDTVAASIRSSIEVDNEEPIVGQVKPLTTEEIRVRAMDTYAAQNRAVTKQDYISVIYKMPAKLGSVKRTNIIQDKNSLKRNLNIYVISEDLNENFIETPSTVKENLKTWLNNYKMINDSVDILNGKVANIGIEFEVVGVLDKDPTEIIEFCLTALKNKYSEKMHFGVPFYISDVYKTLNDISEVIDTTIVKIVNKRGVGYENSNYDVEANIVGDNRFVIVPEDVVLELKYPDKDIIGAVV